MKCGNERNINTSYLSRWSEPSSNPAKIPERNPFNPGLSLGPSGTKCVSYTVKRADLTFIAALINNGNNPEIKVVYVNYC